MITLNSHWVPKINKASFLFYKTRIDYCAKISRTISAMCGFFFWFFRRIVLSFRLFERGDDICYLHVRRFYSESNPDDLPSSSKSRKQRIFWRGERSSRYNYSYRYHRTDISVRVQLLFMCYKRITISRCSSTVSTVKS